MNGAYGVYCAEYECDNCGQTFFLGNDDCWQTGAGRRQAIILRNQYPRLAFCCHECFLEGENDDEQSD
jgi:hypothetical protein